MTYKAILFSGTDPHKECYVFISKSFLSLMKRVLNEFESRFFDFGDEKDAYIEEEKRKQSFLQYKEEYLKDIESEENKESKGNNENKDEIPIRTWSDIDRYERDYCPHELLVEEHTLSSYNWKIYLEDIEKEDITNDVISITIFEH